MGGRAGETEQPGWQQEWCRPGLFSVFIVRTARSFGTASAAAAGRFFNRLARFCCFLGRLFLGLFLQFLFREDSRLIDFFLDGGRGGIFAAVRCLLYSLASATCAGFGGASTTSRCIGSLAGTTCAGFGASAAVACCMGSGQGKAACTDQTGNTETGKEFFQILAIHRFPPSLRLRRIKTER